MRKFKYALCFVLVFCIMNFTSCTLLTLVDNIYEAQEKKYYSDRNNFVTVEAVCVDFFTDDEWFPGEYFLHVSNMVYENMDDSKYRFIDSSFRINEANSDILRSANIEEKLVKGVSFKFISAPEYFGDGYTYPIVGIEIDGNVLLDFDEGYKNLMESYE